MLATKTRDSKSWLVSLRDFRVGLSDWISRVRINSDTVIVTRNGKPAAKMVPLTAEDIEAFEGGGPDAA